MPLPLLEFWGVLLQAQVLSNDAVEGLTRLVWEGPDHPITPAALHAIANLAADNKQAQDALREAGRHHHSSTLLCGHSSSKA